MKASEYRKRAAKAAVTHDVELPSGAVFRLRTPPLAQWIASGTLPLALLSKMQKAASLNGDNEADTAKDLVAQMTEAEFIAQIDLGRRLLKYSMVEPRFAESADAASADDGAILGEEILPDDFEFLMKWLWGGGAAGETAGKFRRKR